MLVLLALPVASSDSDDFLVQKADLDAVIFTGHHPLNPHTLGSTTQIWIGGLLYVDDLALMSTCLRELQTMLHVC